MLPVKQLAKELRLENPDTKEKEDVLAAYTQRLKALYSAKQPLEEASAKELAKLESYADVDDAGAVSSDEFITQAELRVAKGKAEKVPRVEDEIKLVKDDPKGDKHASVSLRKAVSDQNTAGQYFSSTKLSDWNISNPMSLKFNKQQLITYINALKQETYKRAAASVGTDDVKYELKTEEDKDSGKLIFKIVKVGTDELADEKVTNKINVFYRANINKVVAENRVGDKPEGISKVVFSWKDDPKPASAFSARNPGPSEDEEEEPGARSGLGP